MAGVHYDQQRQVYVVPVEDGTVDTVVTSDWGVLLQWLNEERNAAGPDRKTYGLTVQRQYSKKSANHRSEASVVQLCSGARWIVFQKCNAPLASVLNWQQLSEFFSDPRFSFRGQGVRRALKALDIRCRFEEMVVADEAPVWIKNSNWGAMLDLEQIEWATKKAFWCLP